MLLSCCVGLALPRLQAQQAQVPIDLQVELLARLLWYERSLQQPGQELVVLVVERTGDPASMHAAAQLTAQLQHVKELGGKVISQTRVSYESAEQLERLVERRQPYLIYLSHGLGKVAMELGRVLRGRALLTVSTNADDASRGAVLGFELVSSKPRIVLNLEQARAQKLDFSAQVLRVVRVLP